MTEKKILLISDAKSFMVDAIINNLTSAGFEMIWQTPEINAVSRIEERPKMILMYLGESLEQISEFLVYLKDLVIEEENRLFLIGSEDEIKTVKQSIPEQAISGILNRPLNVKELVANMERAAENIETEKKKKHILVVDDDPVMLRTIKSWLSEKYQVTMVNSGMNAITFLGKTKPDLILLDYEMPVCSGPQALEMIRSEPSTSSIPVIFLTAKGDRESVTKVLSLKPEGYLLKTMAPGDIISTLDDFFAKQKIKAKLI